MVEDKATNWIRISELKQYYLMTLDDSIDLIMLFGKEEFEKMFEKLHSIDLKNVVEMSDETDLSGEIACGALGCEIK